MKHHFESTVLRLLQLLLLVLLFQIPTTILAQNSTFVSLYLCPDDDPNYISGSQFQSNLLNLLFPTVILNGPVNGYFNTSSGTDPDTVYGLVQCRGDVTSEDCQSCLNIASLAIVQRCPNKRDATIRFGNCMLRYSNFRFFSQLDSQNQTNWMWDNPVSNITVFNQQLGVLLNNLTTLASPKPSKFETGSIRYTDFIKIYGLVECTRDLSSTDCSSCLQVLITKIPTCCSGKTGGWVLSRSCEIWYRDFQFFRLLSPPSPPSLPPPPETTTPASRSPSDVRIGDNDGRRKSSQNVGAIVGSTLVIAAVLLLLVLCVCCCRRCFCRRKKMKKTKSGIMDVDRDIGSVESLQFEFITIRTATKNFSKVNKLGEGGFGEVYKGELPDGQEIAVKRLSKNSGQGLQEFKNEVMLLHKLQHRNLVRLLGFCLEGEEKLLIYEYVPNRSLDTHLFATTKTVSLNWEKRYKIIGGIARGLLYLHEDSRLRIIHRDLKAANILLDDEMSAKIADFGMAKLFKVNQTQGNTSRIGGTFGYIAPEYAMHGLFSVKSDVFSFGVLLLEIVSGQRITSFHKLVPQQNLLSYAWKHWREGTALELLDTTLTDEFSRNEVMKSIHIGLLCVQESEEYRPTMSSVVSMLNSSSVTEVSPAPPAFCSESRNVSVLRDEDQYSDLFHPKDHNIQSTYSSKSDYASGIALLKASPR